MRSARRVGGAGALLAALCVLTSTGVAGAATDRRDTPGPLDIVKASLTQKGPDLVLFAATSGEWRPGDLPQRTRGLCLLLFRGTQEGPRSRVCVAPHPRGPGTELHLSRLDDAGRVTRRSTLPATIRRPGQRSLVARFSAKDVDLPSGAFRWRLASRWIGAGCPAASSPCQDRLPDAGSVHAKLAPYRLVGCRAERPSFRISGPGHRKVVALTFDDGPGPYTPEVLAILARERVHATFFLVGQQVGPFADLVRREFAAGHVLADHSWNHANLGGGGPGARGQIRSTARAIRNATGFTPCLFRPPYGAVGGQLIADARDQGMNTINWNVDPRDWSRPGTGAIYSRIIGQTRRESIILMHDAGGPRSQTVAALPKVIHELRRRGYGFVTLPELLGLPLVYG